MEKTVFGLDIERGKSRRIAGSGVCMSLLAAVSLSMSVFAGEYVYEWKTGEFPESILEGRVSFTYAEDCIKKIAVSAAAGDSIVFAGDAMRFVKADNNTTASVTIPNMCTLVFRNEVDARSLSVVNATPSSRHRTWYGYETFIDTEWKTIFEDVKLDDVELVNISQYPKTGMDSDVNISNWGNRDMNMWPHHVKRVPGFVSCQYHGTWEAGKVVCISTEFRQSGNDIQMRIIDAGRLVPSDPALALIGVDIDALCGRYVWENRLIRTTGNMNGGFGMNTVKILTKDAVCRFENKVSCFGTPYIYEGVRLEFADMANVTGDSNPYSTADSDMVFKDGSKNINGWRSAGGAGTFVFETTRPTSSPSETNCIQISQPWTDAWGKTGKFRIRGIDGYPMVLKVNHSKAYPQDGEVVVESNGILEMAGAGVLGEGIKGGRCNITVNKGGIVRCSADNLFGVNTAVTVNGGALEIGGAAGVDMGLCKVTLRDGAKIVSLLANNEAKRFGSLKSANTWVVGGDSPSTNEAPVEFQGYGQFKITTNTYNVAKVGNGAFDADFVTVAPIKEYGGSAGWATNVLRKIGLGTFRFDASYNVPGCVDLEQGAILLGGSDLWGANKPALNFRGGEFKVAAGTFNTMGPVGLYENSSLVVGDGATLTFPDLTSCEWQPGKTLDIAMTKTSAGYGATVQFAAVTPSQLKQLRVNGLPVNLDSVGRIIPFGFSIVVR